MSQHLRNLNHLRLALFPMAYALGGVLVGSTLNRIMIADLGYSATLVAVLFAIPLMISPIQIWIGYRSDGFPILGRRREPYAVIGAFLIGLGILAMAAMITRDGFSGRAIPGIAAGFLLYGVGRNLGHNTFQALVADRFQGVARSRAATFYEVATMVGMVIGAGVIKKSLAHYDPAALAGLARAVAAAILVLAALGVLGQEEKSMAATTCRKAREVSFGVAFRQVVLADAQVRRFFFIVTLTFVGTLAQDVILEPFGAQVLKMPAGETTGLTQYWGIGVLLAMLLSGLFLLQALGWGSTMRVGMLLSVAAFLGPIAAGCLMNRALLKGAVFVMGLGTGLAGAGMLSGTFSFTSRLRAGMLLGVWAVANMVGHAFGSVAGGLIVDTVRALSGSAFAAYATVFGLEAVLLLAAFRLSLRLQEPPSTAAEEGQESSSLPSVVEK